MTLTQAFVEAVDDPYFTRAWKAATEVEPLKDRHGRVYAWLLLPSRNAWPTRHGDRPAPDPGCGCVPCHRPRCCGIWAGPVEISTGEVVAWICPTCLEPVPHNLDDSALTVGVSVASGKARHESP